ncbi:hypothetical protein NL676_026207 [Syzygium grande]|nr:hypothetical protein NL676_026207 [Syzygium grande]
MHEVRSEKLGVGGSPPPAAELRRTASPPGCGRNVSGICERTKQACRSSAASPRGGAQADRFSSGMRPKRFGDMRKDEAGLQKLCRCNNGGSIDVPAII